MSLETGRPSRSVFDRPLRRDPILVVWALLNALMAAFSLNSHTTWSGSLESARVVAFLKDVTTVGTFSYLLLALLPALLRRRMRGPLPESVPGVRSAWVPDVHAGLEPPPATWSPYPYPYGHAPTIFDRPLRRDPVVVFWLLFTLVMALVALNANTTWSGSLEPARVSSFLTDVTAIALMSYLFLCLLPAYLRWCWRGAPLWRWYEGHPVWWGQAGQQGTGFWPRPHWAGAHAPRHTASAAPWAPHQSWPGAGQAAWDGYSDRGGSRDFGFFGQRDEAGVGPSGASMPGGVAGRRDSAPWQQSPDPYAGKAGSRAPRGRVPSFTKVDLPAGPLPRGVAVPISWDTDGAHSVTINGKPGYPPSGFAEVTLDEAGQCSLTAEGPGRTTRHAWTAPVPLIELPAPHIALPAGPGLSLRADVDLSDGRQTLSNTLRTITESRLAFRPTAEPAPTKATQSTASGLAFDVRALLRSNRPPTPAAGRPPATSTSPGES